MSRREIYAIVITLAVGGLVTALWTTYQRGAETQLGEIPAIKALEDENAAQTAEIEKLEDEVDGLELQLVELRTEARTGINAIIRNQNLMLDKLEAP